MKKPKSLSLLRFQSGGTVSKGKDHMMSDRNYFYVEK